MTEHDAYVHATASNPSEHVELEREIQERNYEQYLRIRGGKGTI